MGLGSSIGPFLAAGFLKTGSWRPIFWLVSPLAAISGTIAHFILPPSQISGDMVTKLKQVDFGGVGCVCVAIITLLIPVSGGGTYFPWGSTLVIAMLSVGSSFFVLFMIVEWKFARLPIIPLRVFTTLPVCVLLIQTFLFGMVYYIDIYYLPIYVSLATSYLRIGSNCALNSTKMSGVGVSWNPLR